MIVQWYKGMAVVGGQLMPVPQNGANFNWDRNFQVVPLAGNDHPQNYHEGVQVPTCDLQLVCLDGEAVRQPMSTTFLNLLMSRSGVYSDDISGTTLTFFDGYSGWSGLKGKLGSFNLRGAKGEAVGLSVSMACYKLPADPAPVSIVAAPAVNAGWLGSQIFFTSLKFQKNGAPFDGIMSFNLTYSNNITPDMSMQGTGQQVFPVDVNAGMPSCAFQFVYQADSTDHISPGDSFSIEVTQGLASVTFTTACLLPEPKGRNIGAGRQMRVYRGQALGTSNAVPPLVVS